MDHACSSITLFQPKIDTIYNFDALQLLRLLPDESVNCCVTSPPYFGLRDYGTDGQIGLEPTPAEYVAALVTVFRELRRVLRSDGVMFLNLGDSYYGSGARSSNPGGKTPKQVTNQGSYSVGVGRAQSYDNDGIEEQGSPDRDYLSGNPYGEHTGVWWSRISDSDARHAHEQSRVSCLKIRESMAALLDHLPIVGCSLPQQTEQSLAAILDQAQTAVRAFERLLSVPLSTIPVSSPQPQAGLTRDGMLSAYLASLRSLVACVQQFAHKWGDALETPCCNQDNASLCAELVDRIQCTSGYCSLVASWLNTPYVQPYCTTSALKPKDRMMIPARLAIALQDDDWWLRDEIVWHKPNAMPASVTDRTTSAHEMVYLLTKSPRYWYDAEAVAEPASNAGGGDFMPALKDVQPEHGGESRTGRWARGNRSKSDKQGLVGKRTYTGFNERWDNSTPPPTRNLRSVWTINTEAFPASHFAVMPTKLVKRCILAGCPQGGIVIDPFMGAGTVALVAQRLNRHWIGCDLNPEYVRLATMRVQGRINEYLAEQRGEPHTAYMFAEEGGVA